MSAGIRRFKRVFGSKETKESKKELGKNEGKEKVTAVCGRRHARLWRVGCPDDVFALLNSIAQHCERHRKNGLLSTHVSHGKQQAYRATRVRVSVAIIAFSECG